MLEPVPGVFMLERTWGSNIYIIGGGDPVLIDAGFPLDERRIIRSLGGAVPSLMVATHYHIDHVGPLASLKRKFGSPVAAHSADAKVMEGTVPYQVFKLDPLRAVYYKMLAPLYRYEFVPVEMKLEEGDVIDSLGGLEVICLPGHTDGSMALYQRERGILFSGDTIRNEKGILDGPPPQFTPELDEAFEHIKAKVLPREIDVLLPGHGEPLVGGASAGIRSMLDEKGRL